MSDPSKCLNFRKPSVTFSRRKMCYEKESGHLLYFTIYFQLSNLKILLFTFVKAKTNQSSLVNRILGVLVDKVCLNKKFGYKGVHSPVLKYPFDPAGLNTVGVVLEIEKVKKNMETTNRVNTYLTKCTSCFYFLLLIDESRAKAKKAAPYLFTAVIRKQPAASLNGHCPL